MGKIPVDTETFQYTNLNPRNRRTTDCVVRAIADAMDQDYNQTLDGLVDVNKKTGYHIADVRCYDRYLEQNGFVKMRQPKDKLGKRIPASEFVKTLTEKQVMVAHIGTRHVACIRNKKVRDTWNWSASECSLEIRSPGASSPFSICCRKSSLSCL